MHQELLSRVHMKTKKKLKCRAKINQSHELAFEAIMQFPYLSF